MRWLFFAVVSVHGLIHLMGFAKAFGLLELEGLSLVITKPWGLAWLFAALLVLATGILFMLESPSWWLVGAASVVARLENQPCHATTQDRPQPSIS